MKWVLRLAAAVVLPGAVSAAGCGGRDGVAVTGIVTLNGQPVTRGLIRFHPVDAASGRPTGGLTGPDGRYDTAAPKPVGGVPPGEYFVTVVTAPNPAATASPARAGTGSAISLIPARYSDPKRSGLKATVMPSPSSQVFDFNLSDK